MPIAMTYPGRREAHQHFAGLRILQLDLVNLERLVRPQEQRRLNLHGRSCIRRPRVSGKPPAIVLRAFQPAHPAFAFIRAVVARTNWLTDMANDFDYYGG